MSTAAETVISAADEPLRGVQHFASPSPELQRFGAAPAIAADATAIARVDDTAAYQTLLGADALRYLTLQMCAAKASGHPGGFASSAEAYAALVMLGHVNILTEVGHHAPGYYSAMFLDGSLEAMGIRDVEALMARFREREGLLGHLSGAIPGLLAPAGPLGQGQHFAMAAALLHPGALFPVAIGDGGMGEPYVLSSMQHFHTAYPEATNFLPVLIWNGFSQEHHAMVSTWSNARMLDYWRGHGFEEIVLVDARDYDDAGQPGAYVDSTRCSLDGRLAFTRAVLEGADRAARASLGGQRTAFIVKQLKGAGVHAEGAKSHNLYPGDDLAQPRIAEALARRALPPAAWMLVRTNFARAGGGPAARTVVTEAELDLAPLGPLPVQEMAVGEKTAPSTAFGALVAAVGRRDPRFVVTNADGNEASAMKNVNEALGIRHPTADALYHQGPGGQVYEPLSEDACAGLAAGLALLGGRSLWLSYESFAVNGLPIVQTVSQGMAELRRRTPSLVMMFTAGALEQGRNGWTHQRPEVEGYLAAMLRNGNVYTLFPSDANMIQAAYEWALGTFNKAVAIFGSKSPLPVRTTLDQARAAVREGAAVIAEAGPADGPSVVLAVAGDMILLPALEAADRLAAAGCRVRVVAVVSPRRLYRPVDVAWASVAEPDDAFMGDEAFESLFGAEVLVAVTGGASGALEPVLLRSRAPRRDLLAWRRGETTASPAEIMAYNGLTGEGIAARAQALLDDAPGGGVP